MPATSQTSIRFVLDGEVIELSNVDPTRTVLQYLREDLDKTGTKEGCAEGDCGRLHRGARGNRFFGQKASSACR